MQTQEPILSRPHLVAGSCACSLQRPCPLRPPDTVIPGAPCLFESRYLTVSIVNLLWGPTPGLLWHCYPGARRVSDCSHAVFSLSCLLLAALITLKQPTKKWKPSMH